MRKLVKVICGLSVVLAGGCAAPNQATQNSMVGAGLGAVAGAVIGGVTAGGNRQSSMAQGAALGAVIGAIGGNAVNQQQGN